MYLEQISQNQGRLYGFIKSLHYKEDEIHDILQDTNITLINKYDDFDPEKDFIPWAFAIARFTVLAHRKRKAVEHKNMMYDSPFLEIALETGEGAYQDLSYDIESERLRILDLIRDRLGKKERLVFDGFLDGKSVGRIAEETELKESTVRILKCRAKKKATQYILKLKESKKNDYKIRRYE